MLIPFFVLCFFMHPDGDDLNYTCKSLSGSLMENWKADYQHWNGRYVSNFLVLQNPISIGGLTLYRIAPILLICLTVISIEWTVRSFFKQLSRARVWMVSVLITVVFLSTMPIISEGIFWFTGAYIYHVSCLLFLLYVTWLTRFMTQRFLISRTGDIACLSILVFVTCGFCEVTTLIMLWSHVLVFLLLYKQKNYKWFIPLLMATVAGFLVMVMAPGNAERAAYFSNNHDVLNSLWMSVLQTTRFLLTWLVSPIFVLSALSLVLFYENYRNKYTRMLMVSPLQGLLILLLIMFSCIFPAYWGTGILGQHRTLNVAYFFTIIWLAVIIISFLNRNTDLYDKLKNSPIKKWFFSLVVLGTLVAPNYRMALYDWLSGDLTEFNEQMHQRTQLLETCSDDCELPPITARPKSVFLYDISDDHHHFVNEGWACFYGKKAVFLKK